MVFLNMYREVVAGCSLMWTISECAVRDARVEAVNYGIVQDVCQWLSDDPHSTFHSCTMIYTGIQILLHLLNCAVVFLDACIHNYT